MDLSGTITEYIHTQKAPSPALQPRIATGETLRNNSTFREICFLTFLPELGEKIDTDYLSLASVKTENKIKYCTCPGSV